jgi:hypothetical protein
LDAAAKIFVSYAREDSAKVEDLYQKLSEAGFKPWMDTEDIIPGEKWPNSVMNALQCSDFFLACLSSHSIYKRGFLQKEIKEALDIWKEKLDEDIYLIPVRLEECEVPEPLNDLQWVDLYREDGMDRLKEAIKKGMERRTGQQSCVEPSGINENKKVQACGKEKNISDNAEQTGNLKITWDEVDGTQLTALVMNCTPNVSLGSLVELLVEHWDLPVWKDKPIAYDLRTTRDTSQMELSTTLGELPVAQEIRLQLTAVSDRLVMAQSPADIPVFDVIHPDKKHIVSILAIFEALTTTELQERMEKFWALPSLVHNKPVYYDLVLLGVPLPPYTQLSETKITDGNSLELLRRVGIRIIYDEDKSNEFDIEIEAFEETEPLISAARPSLNQISKPKTKQVRFHSNGVMKEMTEREFRKHLFNVMDDSLSEEDFEDLLYNLDIASEKFKGKKRSRIRELIQDFRRHHNNDLGDLLVELCEAFPHTKDKLLEMGCKSWLPD